MALISFKKTIELGIVLRFLNFHSTYLVESTINVFSMTLSSTPAGAVPYQYNWSNSGLFPSIGGSNFVHHTVRSRLVTAQSLKKCEKQSQVLVSLSIILQKVQNGLTVLSIAFNRLFNIRPLLRSR